MVLLGLLTAFEGSRGAIVFHGGTVGSEMGMPCWLAAGPGLIAGAIRMLGRVEGHLERIIDSLVRGGDQRGWGGCGRPGCHQCLS